MTKKRRQILEYMQTLEVPANASQIHNAMDDAADLATIYRGLQYLEAQGYLTSFVFDCRHRGIERYYYVAEEAHMHFMHCRKCHRFEPIPGCPLEGSFGMIEEATGFKVEGHVVTLTGLCRNCR